MVRKLAEHVHGNVVVLSNLRGQRPVPYLAEEELCARRDARIRETVAYAAATVPYYRELFAREGIDPRDIRSAAELEQLPLTSKESVRDPDSFVSHSRRGRGRRGLIERDFGVPLLSHYNATEVFQIGFFCEEGSDFHLQADLCHVIAVSPMKEGAARRKRRACRHEPRE